MYRIGLEDMLGLRRVGSALSFHPCLPPAWKKYVIRYRFGKAVYRIEYSNARNLTGGVIHAILDGKLCSDGIVPLDDGEKLYEVRLELQEKPAMH